MRYPFVCRLKHSMDVQLTEKLLICLGDLVEYIEADGGIFATLGPHVQSIKQKHSAEWEPQSRRCIEQLEPMKTALVDKWKPFWKPDGLLTSSAIADIDTGLSAMFSEEGPNAILKQGWLNKRRTKGIGTPWKPVWMLIEGKHAYTLSVVPSPSRVLFLY